MPPGEPKLGEFAKRYGVDLRAIELDVSRQESVDAAIAKIIARHGKLHVVVRNAGLMPDGPA
jgi:NAD(P)-dependent dehydrogenase (short-subunit alcohol dehydrogenase family)